MRKLQGEKREFPRTEAQPPRPLVWLGKRLLTLTLASGATGYAFHRFGTWPLGVIAIATPIGGWIYTILRAGNELQLRNHRASDYCTKVNLTYVGRTSAQSVEILDAQRDIRRRFGL